MKYFYVAIVLVVLLIASYAYTQVQTGSAIIKAPIPPELQKYVK